MIFAKISLAPVLVVALAGCAANYRLEDSNPQRTTVQVSGSSEAVYRRILGAAKDKCYKLIAETQYYPEAKEGDVALVKLLNNGNIKITFIRFEIKPTAHSEVSVTITTRERLDDLRDAGIAWANDEDAPCPFPFGDWQ